MDDNKSFKQFVTGIRYTDFNQQTAVFQTVSVGGRKSPG